MGCSTRIAVSCRMPHIEVVVGLLSFLWIATPSTAQYGPPPASPARTAVRVKAIEPIEGVQPAALDQPRIYAMFRRTAKGAPMVGSGDAAGLSGTEAFLDTGASGIMLSSDTATKLGIKRAVAGGEEIVFEDVGVAGSEKFAVAEPLFVSLAPFPKSDPNSATAYATPLGPLRAQIRTAAGLLDLLSPGMDVIGMPAMSGKVVVLDPSGLAKLDKINAQVLSPGDKNIPQVSASVPLTIVSFARFTRVKPDGVKGPDVVGNPMIGPDPFKPGDTRKGVAITRGGKTVHGTFLLDTGAATSMISRKMAEQLGLRVGENGEMPEVPNVQQFDLTVGGLGGGKSAKGIFFDKLEFPTREGKAITFLKAPLLVSDITVVDAETGKPFTLDGVLGMNYFVSSAAITGGLLPDIGKIVDGPFTAIVIDLKQNMLGLVLR